MNDYIMNRESLKRHCEAMCYKFKDVPTSGTYGEHRIVLELLEQTTWTPVSERLPEEGQRVLVTQIVGERTVVYCTTFPFEKIKEKYITAWMPLPKAYSEVRNENSN